MGPRELTPGAALPPPSNLGVSPVPQGVYGAGTYGAGATEPGPAQASGATYLQAPMWHTPQSGPVHISNEPVPSSSYPGVPLGPTPPGSPQPVPPLGAHGLLGTPMSSARSSPGRARTPRSKGPLVAIAAAAAVVLGMGVVGVKSCSAKRVELRCENELITGSDRIEACKTACDRDTTGPWCRRYGDALKARGEAADATAALDVYQAACDRGNLVACCKLGLLLGSPREGVKADQKKAVALFDQACSKESADGCTWLGYAHEMGWATGALSGLERARQLYEKSCKAGDDLGCAYLASALGSGRGVARDERRAKELSDNASAGLTQGCDRGEGEKCAALGFVYEAASAPDQAATTYTRACEWGDAVGCNNLARLVIKGAGVPADPTRAMALFQRACESGEPAGCNNLEAIEGGLKVVLRYGPRSAATYKLRCTGPCVQAAAVGARATWWAPGTKNLAKAAALFKRSVRRRRGHRVRQSRRARAHRRGYAERPALRARAFRPSVRWRRPGRMR